MSFPRAEYDQKNIPTAGAERSSLSITDNKVHIELTNSMTAQ